MDGTSHFGQFDLAMGTWRVLSCFFVRIARLIAGMAISWDTYAGNNAGAFVQGTCVAKLPAVRQRPVQCEHGLAGNDRPWRVGTDTAWKQ